MVCGNRSRGYRHRGALDVLLPFLLLASACSCNGRKTFAAGETPAGDHETVPLPKGMSPTGVFTTNSSSLVIKAAGDIDHRSLYSWEPGNAPSVIIEGRDLDITRLSDDTFAAWYSDNNRQEIVTLDAQKLIPQPLKFPNGGPSGWGGCEGHNGPLGRGTLAVSAC